MDAKSGAGFNLWGFIHAKTKPHRLNRLRKKGPTPFCHSERSEESLFLFMELNRRESLLFAQNDKINYFFRSLFSLWGFVHAWTKPHRLKPALLTAQTVLDSVLVTKVNKTSAELFVLKKRAAAHRSMSRRAIYELQTGRALIWAQSFRCASRCRSGGWRRSDAR